MSVWDISYLTREIAIKPDGFNLYPMYKCFLFISLCGKQKVTLLSISEHFIFVYIGAQL